MNWLDYGWRNYDAQLGRWHSVDAEAFSYHTTSPYAYVLNNPLILVDPDGNTIYDSEGNKVEIVYDDDGNISEINGTEDDALKQLIRNTYTDSDIGKETVNILNSEDMSFQISVSEKGAIWESPDGGYGIVDGFSGPGYGGVDSEISIFGSETDNLELTSENFESDFDVYSPYGEKEKKINDKKKAKILDSVNKGEGESKHKDHQTSLGNLSETERANYGAASQADRNDSRLRSVNTLIYETANSVNNWGAKGETAAKRAVATAHTQRQNKK